MNTTIERTAEAGLAAATCSPIPVRIDERLLHRIGVREWGMPSICMPGKMWRSEKHGTISCMTPHEDANKVKIETLPLEVIPAGESMSEMPDHWRAALWEYVQAWPDSGHGYGPLLSITEEQRCDFIRNWAKKLSDSTSGVCSIANAIGEFAAYGYELSENAAICDGANGD